MSWPAVWHDEAERLEVWGTLDPPDACMCTECVLGKDGETGAASPLILAAAWVALWVGGCAWAVMGRG